MQINNYKLFSAVLKIRAPYGIIKYGIDLYCIMIEPHAAEVIYYENTSCR